MKTSVNLLPLNYRRRQVVRRSLARWLLVWLVCLGVSLVACGLAQHRSQSLEQAVGAAERNAAPLNRLVQEQTTMQAALREFDTKRTVLGEVQSDRPVLTLIGLVSQSAQRCQGGLAVHQLSFERKDRQPTDIEKSPLSAESPKPAPEPDELWGCMIVRGDAVDNVAVATFVVGLRDSGVFRRVELKSCIRSLAAGRESRNYLVECDL
jgi:hypothetical protein